MPSTFRQPIAPIHIWVTTFIIFGEKLPVEDAEDCFGWKGEPMWLNPQQKDSQTKRELG